jgi:uncharacterized protein (DUF305 family)
MQHHLLAIAGLVATIGFAVAGPAGSAPSEAPFLAENQRAMAKMRAGMDVKPTGDVDRDFLDMMMPHHQGAIDMAISELRYGHNEKLRRIAQEIVVDQQKQIVAMRNILAELSPHVAPNQPQPGAHGMTMPMGGSGTGR